MTCLATFSIPAYGDAIVCNLSPGGCLLAGRLCLEVGQLVSLSIHLPLALPAVSVEMAVVRWADRYIAGLEWIAITDHERVKLEAYLQTLIIRAASR